MNKKYIWLCAIVGLLAFSQLARCSTDLEGLDDSDVAINKAAASSPAAADDQQAQVQAQTDAPAATEKSPQSELDKEIEQQSQRIASACSCRDGMCPAVRSQQASAHSEVALVFLLQISKGSQS